MKKTASALLLLTAMSSAHGVQPGYYLITIYPDEGVKSADLRFWNVKEPGEPAVYAPELGLGYNVTSRWYTEAYVSYLHTEYTGTKQSDLSWQNDYMLTQGEYPFDLAIHSNISRRHDPWNGTILELGPVFQTESGRMQYNANLFFERTYQTLPSEPTQLKYQWQAKYRFKSTLEFAIQGFGELGQWDDWASQHSQSHRIGPAISGSLPLGQKNALKYEAAVLAGKIYGENAKTFSMRIQYQF
jgi:hypothetical protein